MSKKNRTIVLAGSAVVLVVCTILEVTVHNHHLDDPNWKTYWFNFPFFSALMGFGGCMLLSLVGKGLGKLFLSQPEDYYGDWTEPPDPPSTGNNHHDNSHGNGHGGHHG